MITVVMLNWARPASALKNVHKYASYSIVKNIILFNNGASLSRAVVPSKCVLVEASENMGVYPRLAIASLATTEAIFHTDDDLTLPEPSINALYSYWSGAKHCCHGLYGRRAWPTYRLGDVFGPVEVLLTRALLCSRRVNNVALSAIDRFDDLKARPRGNGEDIILSFAGLAVSGRFNFAYRLPAVNCGGDEHFAIHRSWMGHLEHRKKVVARCRSVFFGKSASRGLAKPLPTI
jgi:hypothetical protein